MSVESLGRREQLRATAVRYIEENLADATLRPSRVAEACGVSRRSLYAAFHDLNGVAAEIRRRRLERARRLLTDPAQAHLSVAEVAHSVGVWSPELFSRTFRARFGVPPSRCRSSTADTRGSRHIPHIPDPPGASRRWKALAEELSGAALPVARSSRRDDSSAGLP